MGYPTYANYALTDRMANTPEIVNNFIDELHEASYPMHSRDKKEVEAFARKSWLKGRIATLGTGLTYSNKLMQEKYALDDEMLKPYFKLENVQKGVLTWQPVSTALPSRK